MPSRPPTRAVVNIRSRHQDVHLKPQSPFATLTSDTVFPLGLIASTACFPALTSTCPLFDEERPPKTTAFRAILRTVSLCFAGNAPGTDFLPRAFASFCRLLSMLSLRGKTIRATSPHITPVRRGRPSSSRSAKVFAMSPSSLNSCFCSRQLAEQYLRG